MLLHGTLHAAQQHHASDHHNTHAVHPAIDHHEAMAHKTEYTGIIYPASEHDFANYGDDHDIPGVHHEKRHADPHDKLYDKHFKTYYHEETPTIPGTDHHYKNW